MLFYYQQSNIDKYIANCTQEELISIQNDILRLIHAMQVYQITPHINTNIDLKILINELSLNKYAINIIESLIPNIDIEILETIAFQAILLYFQRIKLEEQTITTILNINSIIASNNNIIYNETIKRNLINNFNKINIYPLNILLNYMLAQNNILSTLKRFIEYFQNKLHYIIAYVFSADILTEINKQHIINIISMQSIQHLINDNKIYIKNIVQPNLQSGISIKIGDYIIDYSLKNKIINMKKNIVFQL